MKKALVAILLIAAAIGGYLVRQHLVEPTAPTPDAHVAFTLPDLEGNPRSLDDWQGKARLVNFWATWCAPCRKEIPLLKAAQTDHAADNLQVIGVAVDNRDDVIEYAKTADFNYPILVGQDEAEAIAAASASGVDFIGLPFTLVVSPDGQLIKSHMGEIHAEQIEKIVEVLKNLESGEIDLAAARQELGRL